VKLRSFICNTVRVVCKQPFPTYFSNVWKIPISALLRQYSSYTDKVFLSVIDTYVLRHLTTSNTNKNQTRKLFSSVGGAHFTLVSRNALWPHHSHCLNQGKQKYAVLKGFRVFCCDSVQYKRFWLKGKGRKKTQLSLVCRKNVLTCFYRNNFWPYEAPKKMIETKN